MYSMIENGQKRPKMAKNECVEKWQRAARCTYTPKINEQTFLICQKGANKSLAANNKIGPQWFNTFYEILWSKSGASGIFRLPHFSDHEITNECELWVWVRTANVFWCFHPHNRLRMTICQIILFYYVLSVGICSSREKDTNGKEKKNALVCVRNSEKWEKWA